VLEGLSREGVWVRPAGHGGPPQLAATRHAGINLLTGSRVLEAAVDLPDCFHLCGGETRLARRALAQERLRIEAAAWGFVDGAGVPAVTRITRGQRRLVDQRILAPRDEAGRVSERRRCDPKFAGRKMGSEVDWRPD